MGCWGDRPPVAAEGLAASHGESEGAPGPSLGRGSTELPLTEAVRWQGQRKEERRKRLLQDTRKGWCLAGGGSSSQTGAGNAA